jgi:hypothetical protein
MPTNSHPGRRDFLKTAAAGAAGVMGVSALKFDKIFAQSTGGWVAGMQINPAIDNRRVICCHDTKMLTATPANQTWAGQNANVDEKQVGANLDQMAMLLTNKTSAADAWSTIFRSSKPWTSTKVAMKTNGIGSNTTNRPRVAIYKKITDVLVDQLGVQPSNIILYDNCDNATTYYSPSLSLTDSTKIRAVISSRASALGGFKAVTLTNAQGISCAADLVDGNIDILVNVAACKSHNGTGGHFSYGSCTLCMKNHLGTFTDGTRAQYSDNLHVGNSGASPPPPPLALFEINKHSAVLGGNPVRQQICIVDALVSNGNSGPGGGWDNKTDRLVMGTFAPIVDYLAANKILLDTTIMSKSPIPALGVTNAAIILPMFLTQFGYAETDPQWTEYTPDNVPTIISGGTGGTTSTSGTTGAGGSSGRGGTSAAGGTPRTGGTTGAGGASRTGGSSTPGSGGTTASGGTTSAGTTSAGGTTSASSSTSDGGSTTAGTTAMSSSAGGSGGAATTAASASGGSTATGGTSAGHGTTASAAGGSAKAAALQATHGGSSGGCSVAGADRRSTPWGAMLAVGAVVAGKLRRWIG